MTKTRGQVRRMWRHREKNYVFTVDLWLRRYKRRLKGYDDELHPDTGSDG